MVVPLLAPEVAHLVHQGLEPVVHVLWLLSVVKPEPTELPLDRFPLGDLGELVSLVRGFEYIPNLLGALQPLHLILLLSTQGDKEYRSCLRVEVPNLGDLV